MVDEPVARSTTLDEAPAIVQSPVDDLSGMSEALVSAVKAIQMQQPEIYGKVELSKPKVEDKVEAAPDKAKVAPEPKPASQEPIKTDPVLEKSWSIVMKTEKENVTLKKELKDLQGKISEVENLTKQLQDLKEVQEWLTKFNKDPYEYIEKLGITPESLQARKDNGYKPTVEERIEKVERLTQAQIEAKERAENEQALQMYKSDVSKTITGMGLDAETSEHVTPEAVLDFVKLHLEMTGDVLEPAAAVKAIHDTYLSEKAAKQVQITDPGQGQKPKDTLPADQKAKPEPIKQVAVQDPQDPKTLNNQMDASATQSSDDELSDEALIQKALKALKAGG